MSAPTGPLTRTRLNAPLALSRRPSAIPESPGHRPSSDSSDSLRRKTSASNAWSPICRLTSTSCRRPSEKTGDADAATGTRGLDAGDVPDQRDPGVSAGGIFASGVVQTEPRAGSVGAAAAHPGAGDGAAAVRLSADPHPTATGGVAREQEARAPALSARGTAGAHARAAAEAHGAASRSSAGADRACTNAGAWISCTISCSMGVRFAC